MLTLAIDPGLSTGIAWFQDEACIHQETLYRGVDGFVEWERNLVWPIRPDLLVYEDYISDGSTTGRVWSSEIIGAIKAIHWGLGTALVNQFRSDKATLFGQQFKGDEGETERFRWLRNRGFDGTPHELDAISHALVYMKRQRNPRALRRYWC